jgi:hypothetical protein
VNKRGGILMAYYLVTAKPKSDRLGTLMGNLRKKGYASMRPFGKSMTYSLENARLREDGYAHLGRGRLLFPSSGARESGRFG